MLGWGYMKIINVEQGTPEWLKARVGMVTGTRLKSVMGTPSARKELIYELIAESLTGVQEAIFKNDAMKWGSDHEDEAVFYYQKKKKVDTNKIGFCISDEFSFLGLSPDRLHLIKGKYRKAVEVKAPTTKTVIKYILNKEVPPEYKWQVVNYFLVCPDLQSLDFVIYDPRITIPKLRLTIIPVKRKTIQGDIIRAKESLTLFKQEWDEVAKKLTK